MPTTGASKAAWKVTSLKDFLNDQIGFIPIISITESWCKTYHSKAQVDLPDYNVYKSNRLSRSRGECAVYIRNNIVVDNVHCYDNTFCEMVSLHLPESKTLLITVYRPCPCPVNKFSDLLGWIRSELNVADDTWTIIINGDLNFPNIIWDTISTSISDPCAEEFLDILTSYGLQQFVTTPTRIDKVTGAANTLDLFITNNPELVLDISCEDTMLSDHKLLRISITEDFKPSKIYHSSVSYSSFGMFDFYQADFDRLNGYLSNVVWNAILESSGSDFSSSFKDILFNICHLCVPCKVSNSSENRPRRKLKCIQGLKRKKKMLVARIKVLQRNNPASSFIPSLQNKVDLIDSGIKQSILDFNDRAEQKAINRIKDNPSFFYSYVKKKSKKRCKIGTLKNSSGDIVSNPSQMADLLQNQFCSVFSNMENPQKKDPEYASASCSLSDLSFDQADIEWAIDQIKLHSAPGEDEFPAFLLKKCKRYLSLPIFLLWKKSFNEGIIDECFLSQLIAPTFKSGNHFLPSNYRPISLTSHLIKIFERVIQRKMVEYLEANDLLNQNQHGFRKGFSCLSELLAHFNDVIDNMSNGYSTDTIYI